jgi:hypothetical protein
MNESEMQYLFFSVTYDIGGRDNQNFILRKEKGKGSDAGKTRILYVKDGVRVRFTDTDIIEMILKIPDSEVVRQLLANFKDCYRGMCGRVEIRLEQKKFMIPEMAYIRYGGVLTNSKDIDLAFEDLYILINLILAKDIFATQTTGGRINYLQMTLENYIKKIENAGIV